MTGPEGNRTLGRGFSAALAGVGIVAVVILAVTELFVYRQTLEREIATLADAVSFNLPAPILFHDPVAAEEILGALRAEPAIRWAAVSDTTGTTLAEYGQAPVDWPRETPVRDDASFHQDGHLFHSRAVLLDGEALGTLRVTTEMRSVYARLASFAVLAAIVLAAASTITFVLARRLQQRVQEQLRVQANYDNLTQLPNRRFAHVQLTQAVARAERDGTSVGVFFIDLNRFKYVNDTLGHAAGDRLLVQVADRIGGAVRKQDTVARFGGDEFVLILPGADRGAPFERVAIRILEALDAPVDVGAENVTVGASIGIASFPDDAEDVETLLKHADSAMYVAKAQGVSTFRFYTAELNAEAEKRLHMEEELRQALANDELFLNYQPLFAGGGTELVGAEALLRWTSPELGSVPPMEFIPLAEDTGLISEIGDWVIHTACAQMREWQIEADCPLRLAVNVSPKQLVKGGLAETVRRALAETGLPADSLEIEITERLLLEDNPSVQRELALLHELGVRLSIDDFGTGYSALAYLRRHRFDTLKIDRAFIESAPHDEFDGKLATAIARMAHSLSMTIVGEGVETEEELDFLVQMRCDVLQGFYLGRPVGAEDFRELLSPVPVAAG